ncbi:AraC-like transcriptional regulator QhpR [Maliponia aquimaris]|uniref:HTH-type transcriptional regulator VirS n=1 Tax=Maliponia aquimaris TaxID=1673631 RepID=A0A238K8E5_9RHOB|nr:AraC family transcriptional regulator [Maliponia aquimaris]SMX38767.1 HTH-type transcriptional regulator VirS [Maliponia aquimaris]
MADSAQIVSSVIRDPIRVALDLGGDADSLCSAARIDSATLSGGAPSLPLRCFVALNQLAAKQLRAPHFGRLVGSRFEVANIGEVGRAAMAAPSLGAALRLMERAFATVQSETELHLDVTDGVACLSYRILDPNIWPRDQDAELTLGVFRQLVLQAAGPGYRPLGLSFEHPAGGAERRSGGDPGCPVSYDAETNALCFHARLLDRAMPGSHRDQYQRMATVLTAAAQRLERDGSVTARVRREILRNLGQVAVDQTAIAQRLGMSRRSLRRHLADEGTSFADILGDCRDGQARILLRDTRLTIPEIADRLDYSEASGFERAFRRRTGQTPSAFRKSATG